MIWEITVSIWEMTISMWDILSLCLQAQEVGEAAGHEGARILFVGEVPRALVLLLGPSASRERERRVSVYVEAPGFRLCPRGRAPASSLFS